MKKRGRQRKPLIEADPWAGLPLSVSPTLFMEHLAGCNTPHDLLMCYIKHEQMSKLPRRRQIEAWKLTDNFIRHCESGHFGIFQEHDVHVTRICAYYEWQKLMKHKSPKWCRYVFQSAFADFLAVLQCRQLGIGLPHDSCLLNVKTKFIKYFKYYFVSKRKNLTIEEFIILYEGCQQVYPDVKGEYELYFQLVRDALQHCASPFYYGSHELQGHSYFDDK